LLLEGDTFLLQKELFLQVESIGTLVRAASGEEGRSGLLRLRREEGSRRGGSDLMSKEMRVGL